MKKLKCYKEGKLVFSKPYVEGMFEHIVFMTKSNIDMVSDLCITENTMSFVENGKHCKVIVE